MKELSQAPEWVLHICEEGFAPAIEGRLPVCEQPQALTRCEYHKKCYPPFPKWIDMIILSVYYFVIMQDIISVIHWVITSVMTHVITPDTSVIAHMRGVTTRKNHASCHIGDQNFFCWGISVIAVTGVMHKVDDAYPIRSTCSWLIYYISK